MSAHGPQPLASLLTDEAQAAACLNQESPRRSSGLDTLTARPGRQRPFDSGAGWFGAKPCTAALPPAVPSPSAPGAPAAATPRRTDRQGDCTPAPTFLAPFT